MTDAKAKKPADEPASSSALEPVPVFDARELLQGHKEIVIMHDGVRYRLRLTRRNKLILQK